MGLSEKCPKRKHKRGQRPNITGCGTKDKDLERYGPWNMADVSNFTEAEKRRLLATALKIALTIVMKNHIYVFGGQLRRQKEGGAIGLELTGQLAKIYMIWWDKEFAKKLNQLEISYALYKRYVDDTTNATVFPGYGCVIRNEKIKIDNNKEAIDQQKEPDEVTMDLLLKIANSIHESTQFTAEYPSKYTDGKQPVLNLKVWIEKKDGRNFIMYEHYRKEVATVTTVHARSATSSRQKKTIMTQELLTIMKNCSRRLDITVRNTHINNYMLRMQYSGHNRTTRYDVYNSAKKAYERQVEKSRTDAEPLYRPKTWRRVARKKGKIEKRKNWYKTNGNESVIFVPCTPNETLKKAYEQKIDESPFNIKVIERGGKKLKDVLHKKDPFKSKDCGRDNCFVCTTGGKGDCTKENVNYSIQCMGECNNRDIYHGESSYNTYTRGCEHLQKFNKKDTKSMLVQHCNLVHQGQETNFQMNVTGTFHNDSTKRQITEGLQIERTPTNRLMNSKTEWNMPSMPSCVVTRLSER